MGTVIGAQLFTVREYCKTPEDLEKTLERVAKMGYRAVQLSGVCDCDPVWLKGVLDRLGLVAPVSHVSFEKLYERTDAVIAAHAALNAPYIGIGAAPHIFNKEKDLANSFADFFDKVPAVIAKIKNADFQFFYHHHDAEFARSANGITYIEELMNRFTPEECGILLDTHWVQAGGGDPAAWIRCLTGRVACIHFKDYCINPHMREVRFAPVGAGNLNWPAIFEAVRQAGVKYAFVEQDKCYDEDPFDCLEKSLKFLRDAGFKD